MRECMLYKGCKVLFQPKETLEKNIVFKKALNGLKEDLEGVLDCKIVTDNADFIFSFSLIHGFSWEQYGWVGTEEALHFAASDILGIVWGIYDFCEKILGVNPFRKFLDLDYIKKIKVSFCDTLNSSIPVYRFRGWFFNDEDYITGWRKPAGKRPVDYLFYSNIISHTTVEELAEVFLRNKLNLIIPSSFLDIDIPEDEENIRLLSENGLYITQHHIEPLGVSRFALEAYFKKRGKKAPTSYAREPETYDEVWRYYVGKWAKYKKIIWQLGLRGRVDRPIWADDASLKNDRAAAGEVISCAIKHQWNIIKEITGEDNPLATVTLWDEGAGLYRDGLLEIPDGVMIVFTDWPRTQLMREDFRDIHRENERKYGVYHHTGSFCAGPHAVQGQKLTLMKNMFRTTIEKGDTEFVISNVQCLRELVFGANAMSKFAFNGWDISIEKIIQDWCKSILPERSQELAEIYINFYATYIENVWDEDTPEGVTYWFDGFIRLSGLLAIDRFMKNIWEECFSKEREKAYIKEMKECHIRWEKLIEELSDFLKTLPEGCAKQFISDNLLVQANIMSILSKWSYCVNASIGEERKGKTESAIKLGEHAIEILKQIFTILPMAEHGKFIGWYHLEDKFDYPRMIQITTDFLDFLKTPAENRTYLYDAPNERHDYILNYKYPLG